MVSRRGIQEGRRKDAGCSMSAQMISKLAEMVDLSNASDEALRDLCHGELLATDLRLLADVVEGIGCLVSTDGRLEPGESSGSFQESQGTTSLLFAIGEAIRANAECQSIAARAADYLTIRRLNAA